MPKAITFTTIATTPVQSNRPDTSAPFTIDGILPSLVMIITVATGAVTILKALNKAQEEKVSKLMEQIETLDDRITNLNLGLSSLGEKYATKQELVALDRRIESYFTRLDGKLDAVILTCKG
jgi:hypothetical protein